jgi:prolyl oligopeptidase
MAESHSPAPLGDLLRKSRGEATRQRGYGATAGRGPQGLIRRVPRPGQTNQQAWPLFGNSRKEAQEAQGRAGYWLGGIGCWLGAVGSLRGSCASLRPIGLAVSALLCVLPLYGLGAEADEVSALERRLGEMVRIERVGLPVAAAEQIFHLYNPGSAPRDRLVVRRDWKESPRTVVDPMSEAGTPGIGGFVPAPDGSQVAVTLTQPGRVTREVGVWRTADGGRLGDRLSGVVGDAPLWSADGGGFFYTARAPGDGGLELRYHRIGTPQVEDLAVFRGSPESPYDRLRASLTADGRDLLVEHSRPGNLGNGVVHIPLGTGNHPAFGRAPRPLIPAAGDRYEFVGNDGDVLLFFTDANASRGRVIALDLRSPASHRGVVQESVDWNGVIEEVHFFAGRIVVRLLDNVTNRLHVYDFSGRAIGEVALPDNLPVRVVGGNRDRPEFWILAESLVHPGILFRHDLGNGRTERVHERRAPLDPAVVRSRRYSYPTGSGPAILLFVTRTEKVLANPQVPWWLHGIGGFGQVAHRGFSPLAVLWLERGGVVAHASYRGGGEYGQGFHRAGTGDLRRNSYQDCASAVRFLKENRMADPSRLVVSGAGIGATTLAGALALQPDLAAAVVLDGGFYRFVGARPAGAPVDWTVEFGVGAALPAGVAAELLPAAASRLPAVLLGFNPGDELVPADEVPAFADRLSAARAPDTKPVRVHATVAANPGAGRGEADQDERIRWMARQAQHALAAVAPERKQAGPAR